MESKREKMSIDFSFTKTLSKREREAGVGEIGKKIIKKRLLAQKERQSGRRKGETEAERRKIDGVRFPRR